MKMEMKLKGTREFRRDIGRVQVKREIVARKEVIVTRYTKREVEMLEIIYVLRKLHLVHPNRSNQ